MAKIPTPVGDAPVIPVLLVTVGAYLAWFGVHYFRTSVKWPTDPLKAVLTGKPLPDATRAPAAHVNVVSSLESALNPAATPSPYTTGGAIGSTQQVRGTYDHAGLEQLWTSNGGSPSTANVAAAVAQAESGGRPDVTSANPDGGTNVGLWQLDTRGKGAGHTVAELSDPNTNARLAVMGSVNGSNWSAWSTYGSGAYKRWLQ